MLGALGGHCRSITTTAGGRKRTAALDRRMRDRAGDPHLIQGDRRSVSVCLPARVARDMDEVVLAAEAVQHGRPAAE